MPEKSSFDFAPFIGLLVAIPVLIPLFIVVGVFNLAKFMVIVFDPIFIGINLGLIGLFFAFKKLSGKTVLFSGLFTGIIYWIVGIGIAMSSSVGIVCQIPILGSLICGAGTLISVIIDLPGYIMAGLLISALSGFLLMLLVGKTQKR